MMKNLNLILLIIGTFMLQSCETETKVNGVPTDPEGREELYEEIINNDKHFSEFMDVMHENQTAMRNMRQNRGMMNNMMRGKGMRHFMEAPEMRKDMMQMMMDDTTALNVMVQMMRRRDMMNEECAQMLRKRMSQMQAKADSTATRK